jgi:hypothetical protein
MFETVKNFLRRYTGYPRQPLQSRVIQFQSEEHLQELLSEGKPVLLSLHVPGMPQSLAFRSEFERMSAIYSKVNFLWVNCATTGTWFCQQRQPKQIPWVELFHAHPDEEDDIVRVEIILFGRFEYSAYGIREFLKQKKGIRPDHHRSQQQSGVFFRTNV